MKSIEYVVYEEFGSLNARPILRKFKNLSIEQENKRLELILNRLRVEDMGLIKEIIKLQNELNSKE